MNNRVLVVIPSGNGVPVERVAAMSRDAAKDIMRLGSEDENSWYAGAEIISDVDEYARYGYKVDAKLGLVKDDEAIHASRHKYEAYLNRQNKADDLSDETEASMTAMVSALQEQVNQLTSKLDQSDTQRAQEVIAEKKAKAADVAASKQKKTKTND